MFTADAPAPVAAPEADVAVTILPMLFKLGNPRHIGPTALSKSWHPVPLNR